MSMPAILSALRGGGRRHVSASTIGVKRATGSHVLRLDGYAHVLKTVANGVEMRSDKFNVGGHDWRLLCYPNGFDQYKGYLSLFLQHASHAKTGDATAMCQLSILNQAGVPVPSYTKPITEYTFKRTAFAWGKRDFLKHQDLDRERHLKDDCLTVLCDVTVTDYHIDHTGSSVVGSEQGETSQGGLPHCPDHYAEVVASAAAPPFDLDGRLEAMWNIKKVDVEITVGGETFPAHRWVLEAQSPVFKTELSLASTAAGTARLRVFDMDAETFKALLRFMYTDSPPELEEATMAEKLLVAADRYKLERLKLLCEEALCRHIGNNSMAATLAFAERHRCSLLEAACVKFLRSPGNLEEFLANGGIEQIKTAGYPSALRQL